MYSIILCATDGREHSERALHRAAEMAAQDGAELHVAHCVERIFGGKLAGEDLAINERDIAAALSAAADEIERVHGIAATIHSPRVRVGRVADELARMAKRVDADLIVMGTRGRSSLGGLVVGSVTQRLLHLSTRPVLVVPPDGRDRQMIPARGARAPEPVS